MKKLLLLTACFAICIALSTIAFGQKNSTTTGCGTDVTNLALTVEPAAVDKPYRITPDFLSAYATKKTKGDQITAMFQIGNCSHDFTLNLNFSPRYLNVSFPDGTSYQGKFYNFDRIASVPLTKDIMNTDGTVKTVFTDTPFCKNGADPAPNGFVVKKNGDGTYQDNYGGCGKDENGNYYVRRSVGSNLDDLASNNDYRLRFKHSPIENNGGNAENVAKTSYIKVYHPTANEWVIIPETTTIDFDGDGVLDDLNNDGVPDTGQWGAKLEYIDKFYLRGVYDMPFRFILNRL